MQKGSQCGTTILFTKSASVVVGLYSGAQVAKSSASTMLDSFHDQVQKGSTAFQVCSTKNATLTFGVYAAGFLGLGVAQDGVKIWTNGLCLNSGDDLIKYNSRSDLCSTLKPK